MGRTSAMHRSFLRPFERLSASNSPIGGLDWWHPVLVCSVFSLSNPLLPLFATSSLVSGADLGELGLDWWQPLALCHSIRK